MSQPFFISLTIILLIHSLALQRVATYNKSPYQSVTSIIFWLGTFFGATLFSGVDHDWDSQSFIRTTVATLVYFGIPFLGGSLVHKHLTKRRMDKIGVFTFSFLVSFFLIKPSSYIGFFVICLIGDCSL